jgi:hypothetical protein
MARAHQVTARQLGKALAPLVAAERSLERLLVSSASGYPELWMVTAPADAEAERRLYEQGLSLYDRFPVNYFRVHVLNRGHFEGHDITGVMPADAQDIPLPRL